MLAIAVGVVFLTVGLVGVGYAPAIVEAQRREGMTPFDDSELEESDRVTVTRATGAVAALIGLALLGYGLV
ncbi:hypothetical protein [Natronococcus occultus]|uniref:DUF1772 domain-containing protein n=1 Tax=Natronococcus occultus SP4 TaxID=694430 RepID=L0JVL2_9EURY|nr:hypothetical protein [Natronococcus occultus]AGB36791.1 hypothetical protein Natoc_0943 [Natronococcus occultus SP4]